MLKLTLN